MNAMSDFDLPIEACQGFVIFSHQLSTLDIARIREVWLETYLDLICCASAHIFQHPSLHAVIRHILVLQPAF